MVKVLLKNDLSYMKRDPMMLMTLLLPFLLIGVYQGMVSVLPILLGEVVENYVDLYRKPLQYVMITMGSCMPGVVMALRILEDKDENMLAYYAVSPLKLTGYYLYRGIGSAGLSFATALVACLGIMQSVPRVYILYITELGLLLTLAIGILAQNKLQGMVCMKLTGIVVILPCIRLFGENQMDWILKYQPWDYTYELIVKESINSWVCMLYITFVIGLCTVLLRKGTKVN